MVSALVLILCLTLPLFMCFFFQKQKTFKNKAFPPGPRGLPIIGNLHQLDDSSLYLQLFELSKKYGPIFSLQLGLRKAIVISSPELAKEALKNHDREFAGRPNLIGQQKLTYNGLGITFSPYNEFWRETRKICVAHVLSSSRVSSFSSIRKFEVKQWIKKISSHASSKKVTNLNEMILSLTSTIICRIAFGRRYEDEGVERSRFHDLFNECQAMLGGFFVSDYIPFLGWIDRLNGMHARLNKIFKELDKFYQEVIDEHMDPNRDSSKGEDIIDVLLQLKNQRSFSFDLTINHIKAMFMDILVAGTDTTAATTVWAMTALIKNPRVMKKVQDEIRNFGGQKDFLEEEDIQKCIYFKAVMKETLRLHVPVPLVPKETNKTCIIQGYKIPSKTIVYVNAWAIHRDPEAWKDPYEFYPERFLGSDIDFLGQHFEMIPFGAGRRICPGMHMGLASLDLILANLLYSFDWGLPEGMKKEDIDTQVLPGLTQHKKNPLYLIAKNNKDL
ncbi:cytochrome P450 83B1-like [Arachis stenosperma]|uniref:cytochrome P450 83B1-like n=1 Tax=Arachis stenosperma TaxID=217475 RepID=UPI0025ACE786|nr:cytochrome P450 83B1-like [Arachis stenosperma]